MNALFTYMRHELDCRDRLHYEYMRLLRPYGWNPDKPSRIVWKMIGKDEQFVEIPTALVSIMVGANLWEEDPIPIEDPNKE